MCLRQWRMPLPRAPDPLTRQLGALLCTVWRTRKIWELGTYFDCVTLVPLLPRLAAGKIKGNIKALTRLNCSNVPVPHTLTWALKLSSIVYHELQIGVKRRPTFHDRSESGSENSNLLQTFEAKLPLKNDTIHTKFIRKDIIQFNCITKTYRNPPQ